MTAMTANEVLETNDALASAVLALEFPLPEHLMGEVLFDHALYLWNVPTGRRRLFEILNVLPSGELAVVAAPGEIEADTIFHVIRGDDPRFGLKDTLTIFAYFSESDTTVLELSDLRDRSIGGKVSADALTGARLAPNPRFPQRTFEITGYGYRLADGVVQLYVKGDLTGLIDAPAPGLAADPVFIYAKALPLSPIAFAGYYHDSETGLNYAWNRFQSPTTGRWLTRDPAGYGDGMNLYVYAGNDPVSRVDSRGLNGPIGPIPPLPGSNCCADTRTVTLQMYYDDTASPKIITRDVRNNVDELFARCFKTLKCNRVRIKWTVMPKDKTCDKLRDEGELGKSGTNYLGFNPTSYSVCIRTNLASKGAPGAAAVGSDIANINPEEIRRNAEDANYGGTLANLGANPVIATANVIAHEVGLHLIAGDVFHFTSDDKPGRLDKATLDPIGYRELGTWTPAVCAEMKDELDVE